MRVCVKQKCFQFVLESVQRGVRRPQIVWQTVLYSWSTDREAAVAVACPPKAPLPPLSGRYGLALAAFAAWCVDSYQSK